MRLQHDQHLNRLAMPRLADLLRCTLEAKNEALRAVRWVPHFILGMVKEDW